MRFDNVYFINGTAYAGKSTLVGGLAKKHNGMACRENYHNAMLDKLSREEFPCLTYTRDLKDWREFIRRTPDEYEAWVDGCKRECTVVELRMLEKLSKLGRKVFVDTNIPVEVLREISDSEHVLIMLADPEVSVGRFFDRPDREKQFLYRLLLQEEDPERAMENFRACLSRVNSPERYREFLESGFPVLLRSEDRTAEETLLLAERHFGLA